MREIKFRGKSDNDWAYGYLLKVDEINQAEHEHFNYFIQSDFIQLEEYVEYYITDDNTIGQFTGLYDKNGKEIYEGDIVKLHYIKNGSKEIKANVVYSDDYAQYVIKDTGYVLYEYEPLCDYEDIEIIGNIYDNPELLERS